MAVRDWTRGQLATGWVAMVALSFLVAFGLLLVFEEGGNMTVLLLLWALIFAALSLPALVVTWMWFGRSGSTLS